MGTSLSRELRKQTLRKAYSDHDLEEFEAIGVRYKPESLDSICKMTKFTRKEVQLMYRGFKQGCPSGIVSLQQFKEIYSQFFPHGEGKLDYAEFVFNTFDTDSNGSISFEEFLIGLSIISRGTFEEKLEWIFDLYDIHHKSAISRQELYTVISSVYDMMGSCVEPAIDERSKMTHVNEIFLKMDRDRDGIISKEEFLEHCKEGNGRVYIVAVLAVYPGRATIQSPSGLKKEPGCV